MAVTRGNESAPPISFKYSFFAMDPHEPYNVALLGVRHGRQRRGPALARKSERLAAGPAGRSCSSRRAGRSPDKVRTVPIPAELITTDSEPSWAIRPSTSSSNGGRHHLAGQMVLDLLAAGKHVVTANKATLATHGGDFQHGPQTRPGHRLRGQRRRRHSDHRRPVAGAGGQSDSVAARASSTAPAITSSTSMSEQRHSYREAPAEAQKLGYAEADPTLDVNGTDTAQKLAILAQIAFGVTYPVSSITRRGIANLQQIDVHFARESGTPSNCWPRPGSRTINWPCTCRPCCCGTRRRWPRCATLSTPSSCWAMPSAARCIMAGERADADGQRRGRRRYRPRGGPRAANLPDDAALVRPANGIHLRDVNSVPSRFYLRLEIKDEPGVLADVARILADHRISIASVIQHELRDDQEGSTVPLVIMTHSAPTGNFTGTISALNNLGSVQAPVVFFPVGE